jgi:osmotically-inducible protein OsmY
MNCAYIEILRVGGEQRAVVDRKVKSELINNPIVETAALRVRVEDNIIVLGGFA